MSPTEILAIAGKVEEGARPPEVNVRQWVQHLLCCAGSDLLNLRMSPRPLELLQVLDAVFGGEAFVASRPYADRLACWSGALMSACLECMAACTEACMRWRQSASFL